MTELSFLIQLLLNEKLPVEIKKEVAERIKDVEQRLVQPVVSPTVFHSPIAVARNAQAPSTQRILDEMVADPSGNNSIPQAPAVAIPATPAAAHALQSRQEAINKAGKIEPGRTSARKF